MSQSDLTPEEPETTQKVKRSIQVKSTIYSLNFHKKALIAKSANAWRAMQKKSWRSRGADRKVFNEEQESRPHHKCAHRNSKGDGKRSDDGGAEGTRQAKRTDYFEQTSRKEVAKREIHVIIGIPKVQTDLRISQIPTSQPSKKDLLNGLWSIEEKTRKAAWTTHATEEATVQQSLGRNSVHSWGTSMMRRAT